MIQKGNLAGIRDDCCVDPETIPDSELAGIAAWAWKCRLERRIYRGRDSTFAVQRLALDEHVILLYFDFMNRWSSLLVAN